MTGLFTFHILGKPVSPILSVFFVLLAIGCTIHIILHIREPRAALWWTAIVWIFPVAGAAAYWLIGFNRIKRKLPSVRRMPRPYKTRLINFFKAENLYPFFLGRKSWYSFNHLIKNITNQAVVGGNKIVPLINGENAYPAMLEAIDGAQKSITLLSYIFTNDRVGRWFLDALARAVQRGVEVRVLIDDVGSGLFMRSAYPLFKKMGIPVASFHPPFSFLHFSNFNMRNHRKIMVVDGKIGFAGGMNIHEGHLIELQSECSTHDIQFRIEGPVVAHLQETFRNDWFFTTNEMLEGGRWFSVPEEAGTALARGIATGPDDDADKSLWMLMAALANAKTSIKIMTPYFVPESALLTALILASMRGVQVQLYIPETNDHPLTSWASLTYINDLLKQGCRIWLTPAPFNHSKLLVIDGSWVLFGSSNWDHRSLRINFEFNVECYDQKFAASMESIINEKQACSREVKLSDMEQRPFPLKLRDSFARLLAPSL